MPHAAARTSAPLDRAFVHRLLDRFGIAQGYLSRVLGHERLRVGAGPLHGGQSRGVPGVPQRHAHVAQGLLVAYTRQTGAQRRASMVCARRASPTCR